MRDFSLRRRELNSLIDGVSYLDIDKMYDKILTSFSVSHTHVCLVTPAVSIILLGFLMCFEIQQTKLFILAIRPIQNDWKIYQFYRD